MILYRLRTDTIHNESGKDFRLYGIDVYEITDETEKFLEAFPTLFFGKDKACDFIRLINEEQLEPIHLYDVIEDFLFCF